MIIESSNYIINIDKYGIKIENKVDNTILNMKMRDMMKKELCMVYII